MRKKRNVFITGVICAVTIFLSWVPASAMKISPAESGAGEVEVDIISVVSEQIAASTDKAGATDSPAPTESQLYAKGAVLLDGDSGRILYSKNGQEQMPMASTTKIMTCILVLEHAELGETVEISSYAASMPKVHLGVRKGEVYSVGDLLYSLMLESHNDAAVALAEHVGKELLGGEGEAKKVAQYTTEESKQAVAAFAALMNEKAVEVGCENTWFITPNGLDATQEVEINGQRESRTHSTTAAELALIMRYCLYESEMQEQFRQITGASEYNFTSNGRSFHLSNHNALLHMLEGAVSGKTGFTGNAGYCYVGALERDEKKLIVALLACGWPNNKTYKWQDAKKLMAYGMEAYDYVSFQDERFFYTKELPQVLVLNGGTEQLTYEALCPVLLQEGRLPEGKGILLREGEEIQVKMECLEVLEAPVTRGQVVGQIMYTLNGEILKSDELVLGVDLDRIDYHWCLERVVEMYLEPEEFQKGQ